MAHNKVQTLKVLPSISVRILGPMLGLDTSMQLGVAGEPSDGRAAGTQLGGGAGIRRCMVLVPVKSGESVTSGSPGIIGVNQNLTRTDMNKETNSLGAKMRSSSTLKVLTVCQYTESISWIESRNLSRLEGSISNCSEIWIIMPVHTERNNL